LDQNERSEICKILFENNEECKKRIDLIISQRDKNSLKMISNNYKDAIAYIKTNSSDEDKQKLLSAAKELSNGEYISRTIEDETYLELKGLLDGSIDFDEYFSYIDVECLDN
jgi:hypothetical protein